MNSAALSSVPEFAILEGLRENGVNVRLPRVLAASLMSPTERIGNVLPAALAMSCRARRC